MNDISGYKWESADHTNAHSYLLPTVLSELSKLRDANSSFNTIFELCCGNGSMANAIAEQGWTVAGVDPSEQGIAQANARYPALNLRQGSAYDDLASIYGRFPVVTSLEVVEHVYAPRHYAA